jgi:N-carbamoylputrescine amidase
MARKVISGLIQCGLPVQAEAAPMDAVVKAMLEKHLGFIDEAGKKGVQVLCMQEIFNTPYFCPAQDPKWFRTAERIPDGPTISILREYAKKYSMVIVAPIYEEQMTGVYYNTAAVIDADGKYLGKYRKNHIPQVGGFWEKYYFKPGNLGYPTFQTAYCNVGVYICYDRHFPEGARLLALNGAELVFNPSATVAGISKHLWKIEQPAHAVANGYFMGNINRIGRETPWNIGEFYGNSYFVDPRGNIVAEGSADKDELVVAELDLDFIREVRDQWQFFRDRRPETYENMIKLLP